MDHLDQLEQQSVYIFREAFRHFERLCMLWSIGKDSTVLLWLARKAFFGHVPFPLVHIDTNYKLPEMIRYRDRWRWSTSCRWWSARTRQRSTPSDTFPDHPGEPARWASEDRSRRARLLRPLKTDALAGTLHGTGPRMRLNLETGKYELDPDSEPYHGVIVGARADEEGSRSKERYFSPRDKNNDWDVGDQPPEFWNQFKTDFAPGTHVRIHPLLDWTELQHLGVHQAREHPDGVAVLRPGRRARATAASAAAPASARSTAPSKNVDEIIVEIQSGKLKNIAERSGRLQDGKHGLEELRRKGYM